MKMRSTRRLTWGTLILAAVVLTGCDDSDPFDPRPLRSMDWFLQDACNDGRGLQAAFFDLDNGLVFPSRSEVYTTPAGGAIDITIACEEGALICYGAETDPPSDIFWGVGIDGLEDCADCCEPCNSVRVEFDLLCNSGFVGAGQAVRRGPATSTSSSSTSSSSTTQGSATTQPPATEQ